MSHETAPRATNPEDDQDFVPLDLTPNELPESRFGEKVIGFTESFNQRTMAAAERVDNLSRRTVKARNDAGEWVSSTAESAKERTKSVFRGIGRGALKALKTTGKIAAFVPLTTYALGYKAGEAGVSMAKSGIESVKSAGEAVGNKATESKNATTEFVGRQTEKGKDNLANTRDKVGIGLGKLSLANIEMALSLRNRDVEKATRKREKAEAKEQQAIAERDRIMAAREARITNASEARARIEARHAKWAAPEVVDEADAA